VIGWFLSALKSVKFIENKSPYFIAHCGLLWLIKANNLFITSFTCHGDWTSIYYEWHPYGHANSHHYSWLPSSSLYVMFCHLPDSGRHVISVFQGLFLSRSRGREGKDPGNEVGLGEQWQKFHICPGSFVSRPNIHFSDKLSTTDIISQHASRPKGFIY